jgi:cell division protein ZipA
MPELRWILVAVGVLFVAGLWFWEARRSRGSDAGVAAGGLPAHARAEPTLGAAGDASGPEAEFRPEDGAAQDAPAAGEPDRAAPIRATRNERIGPPDPPVVEIPADAEPELAQPARRERDVPPTISYRDIQDELDALPPDLEYPAPAQDEYTRREPWVRTQPLDREQIRRAQAEEDEAERALAAERTAGSAERELASRQRIVALRLVSTRERWAGRTVVEALEAEGLVYGKYSIFHREHAGNKSVFYVASMVEPGSFDLDRLDAVTYPGISLFAVVPGSVEAPVVFDMMLAAGRRLADRLQGQLQDEQGSTLTAQRILSLREELVHLEHVARRLRAT